MHWCACIHDGVRLTPTQAGQAFAELFGAVFLRFHRRGPKRSAWTPQGWAVLHHLEMAGPLTVTEAARHMARAQSVMSEIVNGLERKGLLARLRDARDRRRTLVWLTDEGRRMLATERQVLSPERLERAFRKLGEETRAALLGGLAALIKASQEETSASAAKSGPPPALASGKRAQPARRRT
jgi:DNA-binding MarR family transcriptional regulator